LEEQPSRAIPYLEAFLSTPDPLEAEARLRLAKALHSLGKIGEARLQLEQITSAHPGTGAAKKAKKMLADLKK
jgi:TolA-binding protein